MMGVVLAFRPFDPSSAITPAADITIDPMVQWQPTRWQRRRRLMLALVFALAWRVIERLPVRPLRGTPVGTWILQRGHPWRYRRGRARA